MPMLDNSVTVSNITNNVGCINTVTIITIQRICIEGLKCICTDYSRTSVNG